MAGGALKFGRLKVPDVGVEIGHGRVQVLFRPGAEHGFKFGLARLFARLVEFQIKEVFRPLLHHRGDDEFPSTGRGPRRILVLAEISFGLQTLERVEHFRKAGRRQRGNERAHRLVARGQIFDAHQPPQRTRHVPGLSRSYSGCCRRRRPVDCQDGGRR